MTVSPFLIVTVSGVNVISLIMTCVVLAWAAFGLGMIHDPSVIDKMAEAFKGKDRKTITMSIDAINDLPQSQVRTDMKMALRAIL